MYIKRIHKKIPPPGYVHIVDAVHLIGVALYNGDWLTKPFQDDLPYRVGRLDADPSRPCLDNHGWEYVADEKRYDNIQEEIEIFPEQVSEAKKLLREFREVTKVLKHLVFDGAVKTIFQSIDGEQPGTPELMGILRPQWKWLIETGQVRVRNSGQPDKMMTVFFEKQQIERALTAATSQTIIDEPLRHWLIEHTAALYDGLNVLHPHSDPAKRLYPCVISDCYLLASLLAGLKNVYFAQSTYRDHVWFSPDAIQKLPRGGGQRLDVDRRKALHALFKKYASLVKSDLNQSPDAVARTVFDPAL